MKWKWLWARSPQPLQRTFAEDVKAAVFFLVGATLGSLLLGAALVLRWLWMLRA